MGLFDRLDKPVFLKEESDSADYIAKLTGLLPRAIGDTKEKIEKEIKLASIGEFGEKNIAFELKNSNMPMYVLHDVHLQHDDLSAQIDFVIVTRIYTFLVECKNLIGDIEIDSSGNFLRNYEFKGRKIKEGIYSPITQNQRHMDVLKRINKDSRGNIVMKLLSDKVFDSFYRSIVVLANPKTILNAKYAKKEVKEKVIRADQLIKYIKDVNSQSNQAASNDKDMKAIAEGLLNKHTPNLTDYTKKYEEILGIVKEVNPVLVAAPVAVQSPAPTPVKTAYQPPIHAAVQPSAPAPVPTTYQPSAPLAGSAQNSDKLITDLKAFRLQKSREENIKPYFIFNDAQMMDLISKMPADKTALLSVAGFGEGKVYKYGDRILKILNDHR